MRGRPTLEFLRLWEQLNNPDFNSVGYDSFTEDLGLNTFSPSVKNWVKGTNAIGIQSRAGRNGGTFAHADIAFDFGTWISPSFRYRLFKEFQLLKKEQADRLSEGWDVRRMLAKVNYPLQTEAIKENIIPRLQPGEVNKVLAYAGEADIINLAVFGITAKQWREQNPELKGNIRDHATSAELTVMSNLQVLNSQYIRKGADQEARYYALCEAAEFQLRILGNDDRISLIE